MEGVLITGGGQRLGAGIARELAKSGYDLVLHYNKSEEEAKNLAAELALNYQIKCETLQMDLSGSEEDCRKLIVQAKKLCSNLSILINNASTFSRGTILESSEALLETNFNTNFKAPFFLSKHFALEISSGVIINILDSYINTTVNVYSSYLLSKKALGNFTEMAAREFGPNFRVNAIAPGLILPNGAKEEEMFERVCSTIALKRRGRILDIALGVKFLIECQYITGQIITIDGGRSLI